MGFLGILGLGRVLARCRRQIRLAEILENGVARRGDCLPARFNAIGSHVGDKAHRIAINIHALIQALGHLHGLGRREAQLARGLLLQC